MHQDDEHFGVELTHFGQGIVEATAADPELIVIVVTLAEEGAVYGKNAELATVDGQQFRGAAGGIVRSLANTFEEFVVPSKIGAEFLSEVKFIAARLKVVVGAFTRIESADEIDAEVAVDIMVAGDDEEAVFVEFGRSQEFGEELGSDFVFGGFAGMRDVAGGEDEVRDAALLTVIGDGFDKRAQDYIAIV